MANVTILGTGSMGAAMAGRLAGCRHPVTIWGRDPAKAAALTRPGITSASDPADAVSAADVVITMVADGKAVEEVAERMLDAMPPTAVWIQASTVGAHAADRLRDLADVHDRHMLDAPVSGSTAPAEHGQLTWLVSGPPQLIQRARPVLDSLGTRTIVAGDAQQASRLKLIVNSWMASATVAMADALAASDQLGVARSVFLDVLRGGPLDMPYALAKAELMNSGDFDPGFPVELARKDLRLTDDAVPTHPRLLRAVEDRLARTAQAGHGRDDIAAVAAVTT
jgi:3-hydroxyisobutyrate dehydrogenase